MQKTIVGLLSVVLCLGLAPGCGSGGPEGPGAPPARGSGDLEPPEDGIFRYRLREDPPDLDPVQATDTQSAAIVLRVFDGLVEFDPATLEVRPAVAERFEVAADNKTYTFHLRRGVRFHPAPPFNFAGREVTAQDVKYSFERVLDPAVASERKWVLEEVEGAAAFWERKADSVSGIEVLDDHTVRVTLQRPFAPFLKMLCMEAASIVPHEVYEDAEKGYRTYPVGCGPFVFTEWKTARHLLITSFDEYYRGRPAINGVRFRFIENLVTAVEEYKAGGLEFVDEVPPGQRNLLKNNLPGQYHTWPQLGVYYFAFNHELPPFKGNKKLREAINWAVDREYICTVLQEGKDMPAYGIMPPGLPGHNPDTVTNHYDPEKAQQLLAEAGYPNGEGLPEVTLWFNTNEGHQRVATQVQQDLARIGVKIQLRNLDWASYLEKVEGTEEENSDTAFYRMGWVADYPDPDNFMTIRFACGMWGPPGNYSRYCSTEFDQLVQEARAIAEPERQQERYRIYQEAERIAVEDSAWLFIYYYGEEALVKPYVKGMVYTAQGDFAIPLEDVSF